MPITPRMQDVKCLAQRWVMRLFFAAIIGCALSLGCTSTEPKKRNPLFDPPSGNPFGDSYYSPPNGPMEYDEPVKPSSTR
jgi:hypothetical protein